MRRVGLVLAIIVYAPAARAGGFEVPDNGTEALGRGGAFTAKASDGTALTYNVAGLARQRGTRFLIDGKISINNYSFVRDGVYPGALDANAPWQDQFFAAAGLVKNQGGPFFAPFIAVSTDFGYFDDLTVAAGVFGPSGAGNPTYPIGVPAPNGQGGWPSPARYDVAQANSVIALPTLAAAYRLTDWLDVGAAFHYALGSFNLTNVWYADLGCSTTGKQNPEDQRCDAVNNLVTSGNGLSWSAGVMIHPESWVDLGFNARAPIHIDSSGTVTAQSPAIAPAQGVNQGAATFATELPWQLRAGARLVAKSGDFEDGDVEIDGVYETWSQSQGLGSTVNVPSVGPFSDVRDLILHKYQDTFSVRLGGAYNLPLGGSSVLTFRAGGYYESPATQPADTRLDFNTLAKLAGTAGVGITWRGIGVNVAYAGVFSPERVVANGELQPSNPVVGGQPVDSTNHQPFPAVNNGTYNGFIHMIGFGVRVEFETLFGTKRSKRWTSQGTLATGPRATPAAPAQPAQPAPPEEAKPAPDAPKPSGAKPAVPPPPPPKVDAPAAPPAKKPTKQQEQEHEKKLEDPFAS